MMNNMLETMGRQAKITANILRKTKTAQKNQALLAMEAALIKNQAAIIVANEKDIARAEERGLTPPMIERLTLTPDRIQAMADSIRQIAGLPDPVGYIEEMKQTKMACELGNNGCRLV